MPENKSVQSGQGNQGNQGGDGGRVESNKKKDGSRQAEQAPNQSDTNQSDNLKGKNPGSRND
jgi:hypothetical protein